MTYIMLEKNLTLLYVKEKMSKSRGLEKILSQTKSSIPLPPQKLNDQPHRAGEEADLTP